MPRTRLEVAREVYEVFRAAEEAAEQSAVAVARCTAMLIEARGKAKLPPAVGSEILQLLARSSGAAFEARHAIVSAHPLLDQLASDLGIVGYDRWLREPWAPAGAPRAEIPRGVRDYLKVESGGICPCCNSPGPFHDAHIDEWSVSRSNHHHNLLRVCVVCHDRYDDKTIPRSEIERLKEEAVVRVQVRIRHPSTPVWPIPGAPPVAAGFVGREAELKRSVECLSSARSLAIVGVGGIGKTQLLLNALRKTGSDRPVLWIALDALGETATMADTFLRVVRERGIEIRDGVPRLDDVRACLVLDGLERVGTGRDEVVDLIERLLADNVDTLLVVTSQVTLAALDFEETLTLGPLPEPAAETILASAERSPAIDEIVGFADGHPLTLRLLATLLRFHGSAATVLSEIERLGASALADPQRRAHSPASSLVVCLDLAYSQLDGAERRLLWVVASSPGGFRPGLHDLSELIGPSSAGAIAGIRAWNLVDRYGDDDFRSGADPHEVLHMLSPVRAFTLQASERGGAVDLEGLVRSFCYSQTALSNFIQNGLIRDGPPMLGRALMRRELSNTLSAFEIAARMSDTDPSFLPAVVSIGHSTMMTLFTSGDFELGAQIMRRAATVSAENGSMVDALQFLYQMQTLSERQMDEKGVSTAVEAAERLAGNADGEPRAMLLLMRASFAERERRFDDAAAFARESYDLFRALPNCEEERRKSAGFQLARALEFGCRPAEALPFYLDALECAEAEADPVNRGSILHHIGNCEAYAGRYQEAMHAYRKAGEQHVELDTAEFICNSVGEAGLIVGQLDPLIGLPSKALVEAAMTDVLEQLDLLLSVEDFGGRNPLVTLRKLIGVMSLALHNGQEDLLRTAAGEMYLRLVQPAVERNEPPPEWLGVMLFQVQWAIRLFQFLAHVSETDRTRRLHRVEIMLLGWMASRAFVTLEAQLAGSMASYLRRRRGMDEITPDALHALMATEELDDVLHSMTSEAREEGIDLGWLT